MKKILSTGYTDTSFNLAAFLLRLTFGALLFFDHGLIKLNKFGELKQVFFDPFHIGHQWSLVLVIFAEVICALLLVIGLFSRLAAFVIVINMAVAVFMFHKGQPIEKYEIAIVYLIVFFVILLIGPGKYSVDGMAGR
jgi:putative oxidoreductase